MKRIKIKQEQLEMLNSLYDEGFELFYNKDTEEAYMISDVIEQIDLSNMSTNRDTVAIFEISYKFDMLLEKLHSFNMNRKGVRPTQRELQELSHSELAIVKMLATPLSIVKVDRLTSITSPDKKFISIEMFHGLKNEKQEESSMEALLNPLKSVEPDLYLHQVGKNCKKKVQKKVEK